MKSLFSICVHLRSSAVLFPLFFFLLISGCGHPNEANTALRKQMQTLEAQVAELNVRHNADVATIDGLQRQLHGDPIGGDSQATSRPALPPDWLSGLFTTHSLKIVRLTGGADLDPNRPGDEGIKIYAAPADQTGESIKAAGSFIVEIYDLAQSSDNRIGRWEFGREQVAKTWVNILMETNYVLTCPWQTPPQHAELTVRVTFLDELTGRAFTAQKVVTVKLPPRNEPVAGGQQ